MIDAVYYNEFIAYAERARIQQRESNLGVVPHAESSVDDDLMRNVRLYDVVERRYAGFNQLILDVMHGDSKLHPYSHKMPAWRKKLAAAFNGWREEASLVAKIYLMAIHRMTGSGIDYSVDPSGYKNSPIPQIGLSKVTTVTGMSLLYESLPRPKMTSGGYQFPKFPKPPKGYGLGSDYYICDILPRVVLAFEKALLSTSGRKPMPMRDAMQVLVAANAANGCTAYYFQFAALIADIADWFPDLVDRTSPFFYGSNAKRCLGFITKRTSDFDSLVAKACIDTKLAAYEVEDVMCDFIRWIENFIRPGKAYGHLDRDSVWNSSTIKDHPYGRQRMMLSLGLVNSFNQVPVHPTGAYVLDSAGVTPEAYKSLCKNHVTSRRV